MNKPKKPPVELIGMRNFSDRVSATVNIVVQNIKPLLKGVSIIGLPVVLIGAILFGVSIGQYFGSIMDLSNGGNTDFTKLLSSVPLMIVGFILIMLAIALVTGFCFEYWLHYEKDKNVELGSVFESLRNDLLFFIGNYIGLVFLLSLPLLLAIGLMMLGIFADVPALSGFMGLVLFIGIFFYIYASVPLTYFIFMRLRERISFMDAFRKCFILIKNHWWKFFAFFFVVSLIQQTLSSIVAVPFYMYSYIEFLTSVMDGNEPDFAAFGNGMAVFYILMYSMMVLTMPLILTAHVLAYYDLTERHSGIGVVQEIENIGKTQDSSFENEGEF